MKRFFVQLIMMLLPFVSFAQSNGSLSYKYWDEGKLVIDDLKPASLPRNPYGIYSPAQLSTTIKVSHKNVREGHLKYTIDTTRTAADMLQSWYNVDSDISWALRYAQTYFDISEFSRRQIQNDINRNGGVIGDKSEYYSRLYTAEITDFERETAYGTDTAKVYYYEQLYAFKLDTCTVAERQAPVLARNNWGLGFYMGYAGEYCPAHKETLGMMNGADFGMSFYYKKLLFLLGFGFGSYGKLKTDNYYYDGQYDYTWQKGKVVSKGYVELGMGVCTLDSDAIALSPFTSIGFTGYSQGTGLKDDTGKYVSSDINGIRLTAGILFDYKLSRALSLGSYNPYSGKVEDSYSETVLTLKLFGARTNYFNLSPVWSINYGLAVGLDAFSYRFSQSALY